MGEYAFPRVGFVGKAIMPCFLYYFFKAILNFFISRKKLVWDSIHTQKVLQRTINTQRTVSMNAQAYEQIRQNNMWRLLRTQNKKENEAPMYIIVIVCQSLECRLCQHNNKYYNHICRPSYSRSMCSCWHMVIKRRMGGRRHTKLEMGIFRQGRRTWLAIKQNSDNR